MKDGATFKDLLAHWDASLMLAVQKIRTPLLTGFMNAITLSGTSRSWIAAALALILFNYRGIQIVPEQNVFLNAMPTALIAWGASILLKRQFKRLRPPLAIEGFKAAGFLPTCGSFPSGHAAAAVAFFVGLLLLGHPLTFTVGVWALLICFSRIYLGVHFVSDVLAGVVLGIVCGTSVLLM